jgi:hypothetical protein
MQSTANFPRIPASNPLMRAVPSNQFELPLGNCNRRSRWSFTNRCAQIANV